MLVVDRKTWLRWGRGFVVALVVTAIALAAVEFLHPERRLGAGQVAAEVSVRVLPRLAPSAEALRRRVSSNENLQAVAARLRDETGGETSAEESVDTATLDRWRRALVVEVRTTHDPQLRRIRFLAPVVGRPGEAAALVETIAAQYAGELTTERWYAAIDRLRSAEQTSDEAFEKLLALWSGGATASRTGARFSSNTFSATPAPLPSIEAAPLTAARPEADRELLRLSQLRATMLETLQPAHPQVVALDARLSTLQAAGAGTHFRRLSAEEAESLELPDFEATPPSAPPAGFSPAQADALRQWQKSRVAVKACLDELLAPAAAEFPVVSTVVRGLTIWELRSFWQIAAVTLGLLVGVAVSLPRRGVGKVEVVKVNGDADIAVARTIVKATEPVAIPKPPIAEPTSHQPTFAHEELIRTVEQASEASGGQVLGVLVRRREPRLPVA